MWRRERERERESRHYWLRGRERTDAGFGLQHIPARRNENRLKDGRTWELRRTPTAFRQSELGSWPADTAEAGLWMRRGVFVAGSAGTLSPRLRGMWIWERPCY